jgi:N-acetylmuramoyl-L-alanine amidase
MNICIDIGHNLENVDTGARGIVIEDVIVRLIGLELQKKLIKKDHAVSLTNPYNCLSVTDSLRQRVKQSNSFKPDLFISIHANANAPTPKPVGTEVWVLGAKEIGKKIVDNISSLGFINRGVKISGIDGHNLYVIKNTNSPAVLIELFFIDSEEDVKIWQTVGAEKIAEAIMQAILS